MATLRYILLLHWYIFFYSGQALFLFFLPVSFLHIYSPNHTNHYRQQKTYSLVLIFQSKMFSTAKMIKFGHFNGRYLVKFIFKSFFIFQFIASSLILFGKNDKVSYFYLYKHCIPVVKAFSPL